MSAEDWDALQAEAVAVDTLNAPVAAEQPAAEAQAAQSAATEAAEIAGLLQIMAGLAAPLFPSLTKIYTPETCQAVGQAAAPVLAKHGWSMGSVLGAWAEELALAAVVLPLAFATWQGVKADLAAAQVKAKTEQEAPAQPAQEMGVDVGQAMTSAPVMPRG